MLSQHGIANLGRVLNLNLKLHTVKTVAHYGQFVEVIVSRRGKVVFAGIVDLLKV